LSRSIDESPLPATISKGKELCLTLVDSREDAWRRLTRSIRRLLHWIVCRLSEALYPRLPVVFNDTPSYIDNYCGETDIFLCCID
jgi:hypothetical protein